MKEGAEVKEKEKEALFTIIKGRDPTLIVHIGINHTGMQMDQSQPSVLNRDVIEQLGARELRRCVPGHAGNGREVDSSGGDVEEERVGRGML